MIVHKPLRSRKFHRRQASHPIFANKSPPGRRPESELMCRTIRYVDDRWALA